MSLTHEATVAGQTQGAAAGEAGWYVVITRQKETPYTGIGHTTDLPRTEMLPLQPLVIGPMNEATARREVEDDAGSAYTLITIDAEKEGWTADDVTYDYFQTRPEGEPTPRYLREYEAEHRQLMLQLQRFDLVDGNLQEAGERVEFDAAPYLRALPLEDRTRMLEALRSGTLQERRPIYHGSYELGMVEGPFLRNGTAQPVNVYLGAADLEGWIREEATHDWHPDNPGFVTLGGPTVLPISGTPAVGDLDVRVPGTRVAFDAMRGAEHVMVAGTVVESTWTQYPRAEWVAVAVDGAGEQPTSIKVENLMAIAAAAQDAPTHSAVLTQPGQTQDADGTHTVLVAFEVTAASREDAHEYLMKVLPSAGTGSQRLVGEPTPVEGDWRVDYRSAGLESWWVAEDDRIDRSDCDSAVFVPKGAQDDMRQVIDNWMENRTDLWDEVGYPYAATDVTGAWYNPGRLAHTSPIFGGVQPAPAYAGGRTLIEILQLGEETGTLPGITREFVRTQTPGEEYVSVKGPDGTELGTMAWYDEGPWLAEWHDGKWPHPLGEHDTGHEAVLEIVRAAYQRGLGETKAPTTPIAAAGTRPPSGGVPR